MFVDFPMAHETQIPPVGPLKPVSHVQDDALVLPIGLFLESTVQLLHDAGHMFYTKLYMWCRSDRTT